MSLVSVHLEPSSIQDVAGIDTKDQLLAHASTVAEKLYQLKQSNVYEALVEREALGSTGFGGEIAIPHAKIPTLDSCVGLFFRLDHPIEFAAYDEKPVDLIFVLLSPQNGGAVHLKALAEISRFLRDGEIVSKLRGAGSSEAVFALLTGQRGQRAA